MDEKIRSINYEYKLYWFCFFGEFYYLIAKECL